MVYAISSILEIYPVKISRKYNCSLLYGATKLHDRKDYKSPFVTFVNGGSNKFCGDILIKQLP